MGIYETFLDCGDGCYCVSTWSTLCIETISEVYYSFCEKHKLKIGMKCSYSLANFIRRYSSMKPYKSLHKIEVIDMFGSFTVMRVIDGAKDLPNLKLVESKKIYFSDYNDEPSWKVVGDDLLIIDHFDTRLVTIDSPDYRGDDLVSCGNGRVITRTKYNEIMAEEDRKFQESLDRNRKLEESREKINNL